MTYRPHIDGLRAIAVLAVLFYHARIPGFDGGFVGVDVFFVISGYLITGLLLREVEKTGTVSVMRFAERRIRRLAPALFVVIAATLVAGFIWLSPIGGEQQGLAKSAIATVALSANHYFLLTSGGYFDAPVETLPLLHTWSLSVEEQFYLFWPWLIIAVASLAGAFRKSLTSAALALLLVLFAASVAGCILATRSHPDAAFYLMPYRAWEFSAGGLAFLALRIFKPAALWSELIALVGLSAVLWFVGGFASEFAFPGWIALVPVMGSALLIYGSEANPAGPTARLLSLKVMVFVGLISYSLYLWHWPLFSIVRLARIGQLDLLESLMLCAGSVLLAWLTFRFVEQPIRSQRLGWMDSRGQTLGTGAALMTSLVVGSLVLGVWAKEIWPRLPGNAEQAARIAAIRKPDWECKLAMTVPAVGSSERGCLVGKNGPIRIMLWGDSHAGHLKPALEGLAEQRHVRAMLRYEPSCPPALGFSAAVVDEAKRRKCDEFNNDVLADIRSRPSLDTVILSARWIGYVQKDENAVKLLASLESSIQGLRNRGVRVILVAPGVDFPRDVPSCLIRTSREAECGLTLDQASHRRSSAMSVIDTAAKAFPEVVVVDPMKYLCLRGRCSVRIGQDVLYSDAHHLSVAGAGKLVPMLLAGEATARSQ